MAKNITKSLLIKQNWTDLSLPITNRAPSGSNELFTNSHIKTLINGSFFKLGLLTSEISISRTCVGSNTIQFLYYPLSNPKLGELFESQILRAIKLIKAILALKEPKSEFKFICVKAPHKFADAKILNDFINNMVISDPNKIKFVVNSLIKEYKGLSTPRV